MRYMRQLLLATRNQHKVRELQDMLRGLDINIRTLDDLPSIGVVNEDQDTLEGNALNSGRPNIYRLTTAAALSAAAATPPSATAFRGAALLRAGSQTNRE